MARSDDDRTDYDEDFAHELLGKHVLVGITVEDRRGALKRKEQFHGRVVAVDARTGIRLSLLGKRRGEEATLPPETDVFEPAAKGTYTLKASGERVVDPDFTCTWRLTEPDA